MKCGLYWPSNKKRSSPMTCRCSHEDGELWITESHVCHFSCHVSNCRDSLILWTNFEKWMMGPPRNGWFCHFLNSSNQNWLLVSICFECSFLGWTRGDVWSIHVHPVAYFQSMYCTIYGFPRLGDTWVILIVVAMFFGCFGHPTWTLE